MPEASRLRRAGALIAIAAFFARDARSAEDAAASGFRAPPGFSVKLFAADELAHDIYCMTIDARGRPVVASRGYIKTLIDGDDDGRADAAELFAAWPPDGAHGLLADADGTGLFVSTGSGLYHLADADRDGRADGEPRRIARTYGGGEHSSNGIVRGPDGWLWWIHGNDAGIGAEHIRSARSPIKDVNCGAVLRISPDLAQSEVFAHGFRNPYDLDFGLLGHLFTYDADGERVEHLPWYSPTRVFDVAQGMHHGWILKGWQHAWNHAPANCDNVERLVEIGRGSPTGVVVYRHRLFPERYRGGLFAACWSKGRVYHVPLERRGSTFRSELEIFLETRGDTGFAPVDLAVGPRGDLFVAIGGRGTRGSVFRVDYDTKEFLDRPSDALLAVLRADQPLSAHSRARWVPKARELGRGAFETAALDHRAPRLERIRAIEVLVEVFDGLGARLASLLAMDLDAEISARAVWAASVAGDEAARDLAARMTRAPSAVVKRAAWEALATFESGCAAVEPGDWRDGIADPDRRVRAAAIVAARSLAWNERFRASFREPDALARAPGAFSDPRVAVGFLRGTAPARGESAPRCDDWLGLAVHAFESTRDVDIRLDALRMIVRGLGDLDIAQDDPSVTDGYAARDARVASANVRDATAATLAAALPSGDAALDRELARTIAVLDVSSTAALDAIADLWRADSPVVDDIHYLLAAGRIGGEPPERFALLTAGAFTSLHRKMLDDGRESSRFWPERIEAAYRQLLGRVPELDRALIDDPHFGLAEHALFIEEMPSEYAVVATRKLVLTAIEAGRWTSELIRIAGEFDAPNAVSELRELLDDPAHRDSAALALARFPRAEDKQRWLGALESTRADVVRVACAALSAIDVSWNADDFIEILAALRRFSAHANERSTREALARLLSRASGESFPTAERADGTGSHEVYAPCFAWFESEHPPQAKLLAERIDDSDVGALLERVEAIDALDGDAERGEIISRERGCHACHRGARRLGPDLAGVGGRLAARDLLIAIADPDREISPAYIATEVITRRGDVYRGLIIYESPAATLLQTNADTTVRFAATDVLRQGVSDASFMPRGLLAGLEDRAIADLIAYLRSPTR